MLCLMLLRFFIYSRAMVTFGSNLEGHFVWQVQDMNELLAGEAEKRNFCPRRVCPMS